MTPERSPPGLILAAPASGSGKTVATLALMRAFADRGLRVAPAKTGPDYIDPAYHEAACGRPSVNLDPWGMRAETRAGLVRSLTRDADLALVEGVMGLFDGAADGRGATADLAAETGWPVVLILDVKGQSASAAAVAKGFAAVREDVRLTGVVLNRVGSAAHRAMVEAGFAAHAPQIPVLGAIPRDARLALPSRHLGLVQARERPDLDAFIAGAAEIVAGGVDLAALRAAARPGAAEARGEPAPAIPPPGQTVAVAEDEAFAFLYPHLIDGWRRAGAAIRVFSPLADEAPDPAAQAVYLPGGYPELHAGRLASARRFKAGLRAAAEGGAWIFGECGGYMALGAGLIDADGGRHEMAGLLPVTTSFADRRLTLGYRRATALADSAFAPAGGALFGHEFHYATLASEGPGEPLFRLSDATGADRGAAGLVDGRVAGSFLHVLDRAP
ncbi:MAG: cobyrinate a,c-diamide synthase [Marivibrio sp.]|uniref:cobyrinate a,c-diamide synthase n=1 Tax=Marivibrio sp. TaxID=2039719 RepID=UPI0032EF77C1